MVLPGRGGRRRRRSRAARRAASRSIRRPGSQSAGAPSIVHNFGVNRRRHAPHWALWVFVAALLMKSAMPLLADASARMQGKQLVEVCTVYGVSLVPLGGGNDPPAPAHDAGGAGDHCALTALTALATPATPTVPDAGPRLQAALPPPLRSASRPPDACAAWVARLHHGPPARA